MAIRDSDYKLLWGRAAGMCSNPKCRADLTKMLVGGGGYNVGEMAHIIAHSEGGPRGRPGGGSDEYSNLILLCPTCHTMIDKAPKGEFTEEMLLDWKANHEIEIRKRGSARRFESLDDLKLAVSRCLQENKYIWSTLGPKSETAMLDPGSNLSEIWELEKLSTIIPNNTEIINIIEHNSKLLGPDDCIIFLKFKAHASAFEQNQYGKLDQYPLFPMDFEENFSV